MKFPKITGAKMKQNFIAIFLIIIIIRLYFSSYNLKEEKTIEVEKKIKVTFTQPKWVSYYDNLIYDIVIYLQGRLDTNELKLKLPKSLQYLGSTCNSHVIVQEEEIDKTEVLIIQLNKDKEIEEKIKIRLRMKYRIFSDPDFFMQSQKAYPILLSQVYPQKLNLSCSDIYSIRIDNKGDSSKKIRIIAFFSENLEYINSSPSGMFLCKEYKPYLIIQDKNLPKTVYFPKQGKKLSIISWNLVNIPTKSTKQINLTLKAHKGGNAILGVMLESEKGDVQYSLAYTTIYYDVRMHLQTWQTENPIIIDKINTYVIESRNMGSSPCHNVVLEYKIDNNMKLLKAEGPTSYKSGNNSIIFEAYPSLAPDAKLIYKIFCKALRPGLSRNQSIVCFDESEGDIIDESNTFIKDWE